MIYFLQAVEGGPIKIGYTGNITARVKQLEATYARQLALLRAIPGGRIEEHDIHCRFAHLRLDRTEQFRPERDLLEFIGCPLFVNAEPVVEAMPAVANIPVLNIKGSVEERDYLRRASQITGVPISEIARRGIALWAKSRGHATPPDWVIE